MFDTSHASETEAELIAERDELLSTFRRLSAIAAASNDEDKKRLYTIIAECAKEKADKVQSRIQSLGIRA